MQTTMNPPINMMMPQNFVNPPMYYHGTMGAMGNMVFPQQFNSGITFMPQQHPTFAPTFMGPNQPNLNLGFMPPHGQKHGPPQNKGHKGNKN